ncbi:ABC transporter ATP-binding protein [Cloacibacillus sp.]|uniref:ABC transporter ATP-binding protein n=1 Tax=Cloacibacillus sp. TaxID=2049023 RepID=UPI0025C108B2|nr:ABC transporter ATP-binding protein [Cloacibacillus sp.]MCC8057258.1 ABC transporter ATP-binding protein [Cloacibacillus sp.]
MLLSVSDLRVAYGDIEAVHGISFEVAQGELVSIIGANGAGKTTTLRALMGLQPLRSGKIIFEGRDITNLPAHKRSALGIKIVPERARCFPQLSVYENLKMGVYGMQSKLTGKLAMIYELFPILKERGTQLANTLSGGEQQQLAIARALVSDPKLLFVDEVSMGLMPKLTEQVFEVLRSLKKDQNITILLVEQNALASLRISGRGYVLETGQINISGSSAELLADRRVREAYLGA